MKQRRSLLKEYEEDHSPLLGVANLFDAAIVLAVALMITITMLPGVMHILDAETDFTMVVNPGEDDMQMITRIDEAIEIKSLTGKSAQGVGERLGTTYKLECGKIIYVPIEEGAN